MAWRRSDVVNLLIWTRTKTMIERGEGGGGAGKVPHSYLDLHPLARGYRRQKGKVL